MQVRASVPAAILLTAFCAASAQSQQAYDLSGPRLTAHFVVENGHLRFASLKNAADGKMLQPGEAFSVKLSDGRVIAASQMKIAGSITESTMAPVGTASRAAEHVAGKRFCADLAVDDAALAVHWCAILRNRANYLRQEVTLKATARAVDISEVRMFDFAAPGTKVVGTVPGSPMVDGEFFFGFESPLSVSTAQDGRATASLTRTLPLVPGNSITYSSVMGVAAPGQMRREFLSYIEQERAHPYRTFLHYNSWYDIGYGNRFDEAAALDRVHAYGEQLVRKRGVKLDSFLFDDGWDDTTTLWHFNPGLPNGFEKIHEAAAGYGFGIGVWLSPWGGYQIAKKQRIAAGEKAGYETVNGGFALSAPKYYGLFEQTCLDMIAKYGVNQFKFDGTGNASTVFPGSLFDSDFSAAIHLIERLRQQEPDIFINLTTGTKPSPFWLRYADSIWRGGDDHNFDGVGSWRQKWITYRDEQTYKNIVLGGPLYPLNSLMLHGIIYAQKAQNLETDPGSDFRDEVRDYFGEGTQLQEMYVTPGLLSEQNWNDLAEAAKWSRANAQVLKDTHWIGGDPAKLEVYGWAAWTPQRGIIVLRNPSDKPQEFSINVARAFELPPGATQAYQAHSPWVSDKSAAAITLHAGVLHKFMLRPFEVLTLDADASR
ncbi:MAG TPA: enterotoxin [Terracidiphilus sp.]|jgi:hypothetical protein|nr:enterotoxin [Terracidiphilus sp.]